MNSSSAPDCYVERMVEIRNPEGLHMRPAMQVVDCANKFASKISIAKDALSVDGKSIMQVTMLAASKGTQLKITANGKDAAEAIEALSAIIEGKAEDEMVQDSK